MCQGHLLIDGSEKETLSKIRKCTDLDDEEVIKALKNMKGEKKKSIRGDEWIEEQGLILFRGKVRCSWTTAKRIGQSGWQLPNFHIITEFKNQLKYCHSTLTMGLILKWDLNHDKM